MTETHFPGGLTDALDYSDVYVQAHHADDTRSHTGNANRLAAMFPGAFTYSNDVGWRVWDGKRYALATQGQVFRAVQEVAKSIYTDASNAHALVPQATGKDDYKEAEARAKRLWNWARDSEQTSNIKQTIENAANHEHICKNPTDFDAHPKLLNCQNGTLDLTTFELKAHDPADRLTKITAASCDLDADATNWEANLERFIPDAEVRAFLQRCAGQALYGHRAEDILYLYGTGANFKSTFLQAIREALGDYAYHTDPDILVARNGRKAVSDKAGIAALQGNRLVTTSEIEKDQALAQSAAKILTDEKINAEHKFGKPFEFRNEVALMFSANYKMRFDGTDKAIMRRIRLVEFGVELPADERDPQYFESHIAPELDGVLAWAVRGAQDYVARGNRTDPPGQVQAWSEKYREQNDVVAQWLASDCERDTDAEASPGDLWSSFKAFQENEKSRMRQSEWKEQLADAGIHYRRRVEDGEKKGVYTGVKLLVEL